MSYASAADIAAQYPQYSAAIIAAAKASFLDGADWAYLAGIIAVLLGAAIVLLKFPGSRPGASPPAGVSRRRCRGRGARRAGVRAGARAA